MISNTRSAVRETPRSPRLTMRVCRRADIDPALIDQIWALYSPYHHTDRWRLEERLRGALDLVNLYYADGVLVGFLGMRDEWVRLPSGRRVRAMYMGLGFISPAFRSRQLIPRSVVKRTLAHVLRHPLTPLYFWTDALSYKPYLVVARNLRCYAPSRHAAADPELAALRDHLGVTHYGAAYQDGVVHKESRLVARGVADLPRTDDPDIAFYARCNPRNDRGDGLLVVLPASFENVAGWLLRRLGVSR